MAARFLALPRPKQGASLVALLVIVGLALVVVGSVLDGSPTTGPTDVVVDPSATDGPASEDPVTEGPATEDPATEDPPTEDPPTEDPPTEDPVQLVDADLIVWPVPADVAIDGDLGEWPSSAVRPVDLPHNVLNDLPGTRQGQDAEAMVYAAYDEQSLYLAAEVDDDVYAQPNVDNQIWRGDALDLNLVTDGQAPPRPSTSTFQITLTPRSGDGRPGHVWFVGNGQVFDANRTDLAIDVAGAVDADGDWRVEARIPWSVVGLRAAPTATLPGIVAVFDNDGETGSSGQSLQVAILTNVPQVLFQEPPTWGTIGLQR